MNFGASLKANIAGNNLKMKTLPTRNKKSKAYGPELHGHQN